MKITLSNEEMRYIVLAEDITRAPIIDCVEKENRVTFIVEKGKLGKAIGKNAKNIKNLESKLKKEVKFVEYDTDKKVFITNLFKPYKLDEIVVMEGEDGTIVNVTITQGDKGKAIGKNGRNINILRDIAKRHHDIIQLKIL
ncbi:MAG: NusA-like transcription termination signal-binding factor [Candidatus Thermoplasmatota archaeon]|nr:NusA-like transcription termination signal-binding factor [Candidatus Thermoplasmatota archaeon]